ncbi:hypothetical protein FOZ62_025357 [Perkinsus olseni]|uniref:Uncharacterized protein n=1 Tax=Perkinsus olseni TaxID=32597 RepID=A0A7J6R6L6_PEROL|nr:hypothetical protein FOZ62_025357 [Perkinsus olseni]
MRGLLGKGSPVSCLRKRGLVPILCIANYGTTNTCAIDPLEELGRLCQEENIVLHVDAAYSGVALLLESFKEDAAVIRANVDSINISGHKWLGTGLSAGFLWVRDRCHLAARFEDPNLPRDHPKKRDTEPSSNPSSRSPPAYRKFKALRIWAVLQYWGTEQLRRNIAHDIECAARFRTNLEKDEELKGIVVFPVASPFGLVCFTAVPHWHNSAILREAERSGFMICPSMLADGTPLIRVAFGSPMTRFAHVDELCLCIRNALLRQPK